MRKSIFGGNFGLSGFDPEGRSLILD